MQIRSAVPENGCLIFWRTEKKEKQKKQKNICKTYTHSRFGARMRKWRFRGKSPAAVDAYCLSRPAWQLLKQLVASPSVVSL